MDIREAYRELGVDPSISDAELKAIWRRLVAAWHPDRNAEAGASRRMQYINKAYQHIRQVRDGGNDDASEGRDTNSSATATAPEAEQHSDGTQRTQICKVSLSLEEAILGVTRTLSGSVAHTCDACAGHGQRAMAQACKTCNGSGAVRRAALFGWLWSDEACTDCGADGRHREPCTVCDGKGEVAVAYRRRVRFPAGIRDGYVLSVPASRHGSLNIGLELEVQIEPHPLFTLDADGVLRCEMPVNGFAWMAGRWVNVPTPTGTQQMRLNRNALTYRFSGQGFPTVLRGSRGDYFVKIVPVFPESDDPAQEKLLDQLIAKSTESAQADKSHPLGQWQQRLKRWNTKPKDNV